MNTLTQVVEDKHIFTVYQLNHSARAVLEEHLGQVWVKGELSNVALPRSGHVYFTLKDPQAQVRCAMFKGANRSLNFTPEEGMAVLVRAQVSIYDARGDYQLIVNQMEQWGVGQLQQAFEALKAKLQQEGLFDTQFKKSLPRYPRAIGIISSPTGAALQDILSVLKRRYPIAPIKLYPTQVQGKTAAKEIAQAIQKANDERMVDVILLARGGGSLEDLWGFNEEIVARSMFASQIPIVTGIGHETDFTIADFVADIRAPTPSAAAETISPDSRELIQFLEQKRLRLLHAMSRTLQHYALKLDSLEKQLIHPGKQLKQAEIKCLHLKDMLNILLKNILQRDAHRLSLASNGLNAVSPLATLGRGYAIAMTEQGDILRDAAILTPKQRIKTRLAKGSFISTVEKILE